MERKSEHNRETVVPFKLEYGWLERPTDKVVYRVDSIGQKDLYKNMTLYLK